MDQRYDVKVKFKSSISIPIYADDKEEAENVIGSLLGDAFGDSLPTDYTIEASPSHWSKRVSTYDYDIIIESYGEPDYECDSNPVWVRSEDGGVIFIKGEILPFIVWDVEKEFDVMYKGLSRTTLNDNYYDAYANYVVETALLGEGDCE